MLDFDHFAYNRTILPTDDIERREFFKKLEQQFHEEIKNSELAQEYFSRYNQLHIDSFIKLYASRKAHLVQCYKFYANEYHEKEISELNFQEKAENMLAAILQKKLFDMQLKWRAGKLEIDEISMSHDFNFWEEHILSCMFIPPVERNELELMKEYIMRFDENDEVDDYTDWQDYERLTLKDEHGLMQDLPEWYEFYDLRMGTGALFNLPNQKGEREEYYMDLIREDYVKNNPQQTQSIPSPEPILHSCDEEIYNFSKYFETDRYFKALFKYYNYYDEKEHRDPNYDDIDQAIKLLFTADRPIYCHAHLTWDKAIMRAAKEYTNTKIAEMLDFVYENYLMMKELGISGHETREKIEEEYAKDYMIKFYRKNILKGRRLNGEPENFDY